MENLDFFEFLLPEFHKNLALLSIDLSFLVLYQFQLGKLVIYYNMVHTARNGKASECVKCGKCEKVCPQHLKIREILEDVAKEFEKPQQSEK